MKLLKRCRKKLGFAPEDYQIKRLKDSFIKNNRDKTIIINPDIVKYNKKIIETSLIQAFCKTKYREDTKLYKNLLQKSLEKYENYEYRVVKIAKQVV